MALKRNPDESMKYEETVSTKAKQLFNSDSVHKKENKILTTFSIEP